MGRGSESRRPDHAFQPLRTAAVCQFARQSGWSSLALQFRGPTVSGFFENVASLVAPLRDVLLLILGALISLLGTLLVQDRRVKDELRVRIRSGTVERLTEVENLVALIFTRLGRESVWPLMIVSASLTSPSPEVDELDAAAARLKVLVHSFRRYPFLVLFMGQLATTVEKILGEFITAWTKEPGKRASNLPYLQTEVNHFTRVLHRLIDRIIATDLRTDLTLPLRVKRFARRLIVPLKRVTAGKHKQTQAD